MPLELLPQEIISVIRFFACISLVIGAVECFAGFKIMKVMMAIWGFFMGAMIGTVIGVLSETVAVGVILAIFLGVAFAVLSFKFYLAGVFILTMLLTASTICIIFPADKALTIVVALLSGVGIGVLAIYFVKPVIIISTAISGAGIIVSSAYFMFMAEINPSPVVTAILWIPIALCGIAVQFITTVKVKSKVTRSRTAVATEDRHPGFQKAYRNFCINCGRQFIDPIDKCPRCGYSCDD